MLIAPIIPPLTASLLAGLVTVAGIVAIHRYQEWGNKNVVYFMSFVAGLLILVSFLHIIPKSISMNFAAPSFMLAGFFVLYLANRFLESYICHKYDSAAFTVGLIGDRFPFILGWDHFPGSIQGEHFHRYRNGCRYDPA